MMTDKLHPEVLPVVVKEFKRLSSANPNVDGVKLWNMAKAYVRAVAFGDTALINELMTEDVGGSR